MTTIFCDPTQFGHMPSDHARAAAMFERLGIEQVPTMRDRENDTSINAVFDGTPWPEQLADVLNDAGVGDGFYGLPKVDMGISPAVRAVSNRLHRVICDFGQHIWPDCAVDGVSITNDLRRLDEVVRVLSVWDELDVTIAVAKTFRVSTMAHLTTAEMARYAKRLVKFNGVYPWMVGRWQFRQYSAMPPDYVDYDKPDLVRSRMEFGDKYLNNPQTMVDDSLVEAEADLVFLKEAFG